ncbi:hypothetical protein TWF192_004996 [Orbilia oligospora]|uniref:Uncharacterized protein n=1 Tax=Orbilia oligospora TaxID=2813651 RepID=A0A6G1MBI7_ORBOL|nr:hypothetical protein TWF191_001926 [Orbilia oligospora]KAF3251018.1 hypothetical protein TWF192_004996 [Orbilia oligospora]
MGKQDTLKYFPDNSEVLVIQLGSQSESQAIQFHHGEFLFRIKQTIGLSIVRTADDAIEFINTKHPAFILVVDSEFANPAYRRLQNEVAFIVEYGAAFIMCGEFPRTVDTEKFRHMALNAFNLGWDIGPIHKGKFELHKTCDVLDGIHRASNIDMELQMTAVLVGRVDDKSRLYICKEFDRSQDNTSAALAFEKRGNGYFGWVGDTNALGAIHNVIFKFIDLAGPNFRAGRLRNLRRGRNMPQVCGGRPAGHPRNNKATRANKPPPRPQGPCDNCGRNFTTQTCFDCKIVFYCSMSCMNAASRKHKEVCAAHKVTLSQAIEMADQGDPMPLVRELVISPKDHQEVLERLIDCYRFRIEDLKNISGIRAGCYRDSSTGDVHLEEFVNFLRLLQRSNQPARPPWWELASQVQCEDMACNHIMRYYIGNRIDEDEVVAHYGNKLMPSALRALSDILYNGPVPERTEDPGDEGDNNQMAGTDPILGLDELGQWEQDSSSGTDDIDRVLNSLKLEDPISTVAVIETKQESPAPTSPSPPASMATRPGPTAPEAPIQPQAPRKKREPIVHVWEPPTAPD